MQKSKVEFSIDVALRVRVATGARDTRNRKCIADIDEIEN